MLSHATTGVPTARAIIFQYSIRDALAGEAPPPQRGGQEDFQYSIRDAAWFDRLDPGACRRLLSILY